MSGNICCPNTYMFNYCLQYINNQYHSIMASHRSFTTIKPNHILFMQAYFTFVNSQTIYFTQNCPLFLWNFVELFFLLSCHYKICLPIENPECYSKTKIILVIVQHNFLPFQVVPIIFSVSHLHLLYNKICLLIKILNPWV